jgi:hypothetical protein
MPQISSTNLQTGQLIFLSNPVIAGAPQLTLQPSNMTNLTQGSLNLQGFPADLISN